MNITVPGRGLRLAFPNGSDAAIACRGLPRALSRSCLLFELRPLQFEDVRPGFRVSQ